MFGVWREMGVSQNYGYPFGGPQNKDYSILGSILGPFILGNYQIFRVVLLHFREVVAYSQQKYASFLCGFWSATWICVVFSKRTRTQ